jgi:hypothetical protein
LRRYLPYWRHHCQRKFRRLRPNTARNVRHPDVHKTEKWARERDSRPRPQWPRFGLPGPRSRPPHSSSTHKPCTSYITALHGLPSTSFCSGLNFAPSHVSSSPIRRSPFPSIGLRPYRHFGSLPTRRWRYGPPLRPSRLQCDQTGRPLVFGRNAPIFTSPSIPQDAYLCAPHVSWGQFPFASQLAIAGCRCSTSGTGGARPSAVVTLTYNNNKKKLSLPRWLFDPSHPDSLFGPWDTVLESGGGAPISKALPNPNSQFDFLGFVPFLNETHPEVRRSL